MYTLFYNKDCSDCAKQVALDSKLDWLGRIAFSTAPPPTGILDKGEIVVISATGKVFTRGYATRVICLNIPVYFIIGLLLYLPPVLKLVSKGKAGCNGDSCNIGT